MHAQLVPLADLTARDIDAWRALAARAAEPNPFFEPDFVLPQALHYRVQMTLLTVDAGPEMVACLPLYGHERPWRFLPLPAWTAPTVLGIPLVAKDHVWAALHLAVEFLSRRCGVRRLLFIDRVPDDGPVGPVLGASVADRRPSWEEPRTSKCPVIRRRPTASYLDDTLRGRTRQTFGRKRRRLERELRSPLTLVEAPPGADTVERFLALEASGRKGRAGTAMLSDPGQAAFFRDMCARFSAVGRLRFASLEAGGTPVAMQCDVASGRGLYNLKLAYDERFARYTPGTLLQIEAVRRFHESGYDYMDACTNYPTSPQWRVYPDCRTFTSMTVALGSRAGRVAIGGLGLAWRFGRRLVKRGA
jgi:CelD/BcsL family acetyltransferase involved in cellulose biosynthesis